MNGNTWEMNFSFGRHGDHDEKAPYNSVGSVTAELCLFQFGHR